ncbi:MAG: yfiY 2 [Paenibacillaceae bacterium]|jgi:iron complex transport system substrate-binding protein|nr:yfiY 2 [Paenibacillaceae bacterium]
MKKVMALLFALTLTFGLMAGCGEKEAENGSNSSAAGSSPAASVSPAASSPAASSSPSASPEAAAFPRTYKDVLGNDVVIKEKPKRVAVAFFHFLEPWFAIGVTPVAGDSSNTLLEGFLSLQPYAKDKALVMDLGSPMSLERLLEVKPDLIISATPYNDKIHEQLLQIAPVVVFKNEMDWKTRLVEFSKLVGEEKAANAKVAEIEKLIATSKEKLSAYKDKSVAFLSFNNKGGYTAYGIDRNAAFYDPNLGLGLTPPQNYPPVHGKDNLFTLEGVVGMNPDYIFIWDDATSNSEETNLVELKNNAIWNTLTAVKNNHVFILDRSAFSGGPLGVEYGVKTVTENMTK